LEELVEIELILRTAMVKAMDHLGLFLEGIPVDLKLLIEISISELLSVLLYTLPQRCLNLINQEEEQISGH
jgi:hypothetical protein